MAESSPSTPKEQKDFISYYDDDNTLKNQYVYIINETINILIFKFELSDEQMIIIPWHRILKVKRRKYNERGNSIE